VWGPRRSRQSDQRVAFRYGHRKSRDGTP